MVRRSFPVPRIQVQGDPVLHTFRDQGLYVKSSVSVPEGGGFTTTSSPNSTDNSSAAVQSCSVPYPEMSFRWSYDLSTAEARRGATFAFDPKTRVRKVRRCRLTSSNSR